jgi:hypothetical protein
VCPTLPVISAGIAFSHPRLNSSAKWHTLV